MTKFLFCRVLKGCLKAQKVAIPSVCLFSESMSAQLNAPLIRINPDETAASSRLQINLPLGALDALQQMEACLKNG